MPFMFESFKLVFCFNFREKKILSLNKIWVLIDMSSQSFSQSASLADTFGVRYPLHPKTFDFLY